MKPIFQKNARLVFYLCWVFLGLIQSRFTELLDDEAYYWVYSKFLDWGYFDHPPMVALLIIEKLIDKKSPFLFFVIALSLAVLQLGGFLAVPDTPLIFFTSLFFL